MKGIQETGRYFIVYVSDESKEKKMTKDECAKVLAVKYVYNYNTFRKSEKLRHDLAEIHFRYQGDSGFDVLFEGYCDELTRFGVGNPPRWAKLLMAERYALNI